VNSPSAYIENNAVLTRIFARLPEHLRASFTQEQLIALAAATYDKPTEHALAIRKTVPWFGKRYYLAFFFGRDRRSKPSSGEAFVQSGLRRGWKHYVIMALLFASAMIGLYVTVTAFGITMTAIFASDTQNSPGYLRNLFN
jgi:hypothetical protein